MRFIFFIFIIYFSVILPLCFSYSRRKLLHQPFFPIESSSPSSPPSTFPSPSPSPTISITPPAEPKFPFTDITTKNPTITTTNPQNFFPDFPSPPSPPSQSTPLTLPANISSLIIPHRPPNHHFSHKLFAVIFSPIICVFILSIFAAAFYIQRRRIFVGESLRSDIHRLVPPNAPTSDGRKSNPSTTTSDCIYMGSLSNSCRVDNADSSTPTMISSPYQRLGSPELHPLPPLTETSRGHFDLDSSGDDDFYSPRHSSIDKNAKNVGNNRNGILNSGSSSSPDSVSFTQSPTSNGPFGFLKTKSPSLRSNSSITEEVGFRRSSSSTLRSPLRPATSSPESRESRSLSTPCSPLKQNPIESHPYLVPPPPPLPPAGFWETRPPVQSVHKPISRTHIPISPLVPIESTAGTKVTSPLDRNEETMKPKLKPLHWDKVRTSSERAMVWDQLKSSSFELNEEMIETLFVCNSAKSVPKETSGRSINPSMNPENRVLDPKKSQNIAILLKALNVTKEEVCEALLEGNADNLGTDLLETLIKMAPTKEEELKLKEYKDESPFKLGLAEKFLKAVLDIPFAFRRADALFYVVNFDSEFNYLRKSFEIVEAACEELKSSRLFLKLLEAVLKTGNRMNVGTNRGDAHAFKLDTLLKLVDVKGTDGKTTLLHFVVQEIIRTEGSNHMSGHFTRPSFHDDIEFRKLGLRVVSGLSGELSNVKKVAAMDSDVLGSYVSKLTGGISKVKEAIELNDKLDTESNRKFAMSMSLFVNRAEEDIRKIQTQERLAFSLVKEITEYFHGNLAKEEAHPFRIFMVVRDFLSILDHVCKEVGKINDQIIVGSARFLPVPVNPTLQPVFLRTNGKLPESSDEDESSMSP